MGLSPAHPCLHNPQPTGNPPSLTNTTLQQQRSSRAEGGQEGTQAVMSALLRVRATVPGSPQRSPAKPPGSGFDVVVTSPTSLTGGCCGSAAGRPHSTLPRIGYRGRAPSVTCLSLLNNAPGPGGNALSSGAGSGARRGDSPPPRSPAGGPPPNLVLGIMGGLLGAATGAAAPNAGARRKLNLAAGVWPFTVTAAPLVTADDEQQQQQGEAAAASADDAAHAGPAVGLLAPRPAATNSLAPLVRVRGCLGAGRAGRRRRRGGEGGEGEGGRPHRESAACSRPPS